MSSFTPVGSIAANVDASDRMAFKKKCNWCKRYLSKDQAQSTVKNPGVLYCAACYQKGLDAEYEAMGAYDADNSGVGFSSGLSNACEQDEGA